MKRPGTLMDRINKEAAIDRMNKLGEEARPFFFLIDYNQNQNIVCPLEELNPELLQFEMSENVHKGQVVEPESTLSLTSEGYSKAHYSHQFEQVVSEIKKGNSFLVNLTCETPIQLNGRLEDVYREAKAKYKLWFKDTFVVFSPETFVRIQDGRISSYPMKGTIDAGLPQAAEVLLSNPKEKAEHSTMVDLIRNDLSMVAENVEVVRFRYLDELTTDQGKLLQASSEIRGRLPDAYPSRIGSILYQLLPAGSVTGAPKKRTLQIIQEAETYERGFYTGVFGVFDGKNMDSAVLIRFIEQKDGRLVYKSGGGITAFSKLDEEYDEMLKKIYVPINRKH